MLKNQLNNFKKKKSDLYQTSFLYAVFGENYVLGLNFGRTIRFARKKARDKNLPDNNAAILIHLPYEEFRGKTDVGLFEFR